MSPRYEGKPSAATSHIDALSYRHRLSPALESTQESWTHTAGRWNDLISPATRRTDRELIAAGAELHAAMLEITGDKTSLARPEVIAGRVDLAASARTLQQALAAAVDLAYVIRDIAAHDQRLTGPARTLSRKLSGDADTESTSCQVTAGTPTPSPLRSTSETSTPSA